MIAANTQFEFESRTKTILLAGMGLGVLCLGLTWFGDDEFHTRFWSNWLHNSVYFTGIAFTAMLFYAAQTTAFAGWMTAIKRVWEAMGMFMLVGIILLGVIAAGVWGHFHHLYHWNTPGISDPNNPIYDRIIAGKSGFLSPTFYTIGVIGFLAIWYFWASKMRSLSVAQDTQETPAFDYYKKHRKWAASFVPIGGFLICIFIWEATMSIDPHWYSTMYVWYSMISMLLGAISLCILMIIYLKSKGYMEWVTREHLHDLGKYLFGISVFWTYLWFDQFMLIWYCNNGEETIYFRERMDHYPVLYWGNLLLNFVTPFFILMRNDTKRKFGTMFFAALIVFFGHWWDYFQMIKPGVRNAAVEAREMTEGKIGHHEAAPIPTEGQAEHQATAGHGDHVTEATHNENEHVAETSHAEAAHGESHGSVNLTPSFGHVNAGDRQLNHTELDPNKSFAMGYTIPGLEEIGILIGFLCLFLFMFFTNLAKASLIPLRDPFLEEAMHHQTGAYIPSEGGGDHH